MENSANAIPAKTDLENISDFHDLDDRAIVVFNEYNSGDIDGQTALQQYDSIRKRTTQLKKEIQAKYNMTDALWKVTPKPNPEYADAIGYYDMAINSIDQHIEKIKKDLQKKASVAFATGQLPEESRRV
jgi:hypothetical protein